MTGCDRRAPFLRRGELNRERSKPEGHKIRPAGRYRHETGPTQREKDTRRGIVKDILTSSTHHSRGIKVRLETGEVGRVQEIVH